MIDLCVADAENKLYENGITDNTDRVKFLIDNCALVEKNKDEFYTYMAVNLNTLKKKQVSKRKKPITSDYYEQLAQKIKKLDLYESNINLKQTRYDRAKNLLCHIFSDILPAEGLSFRKNQCDLALEMLQALENKSIALMEAEVGTGKTHAYIIAVIIYNLFHNITGTTLISTSTVALQKAITEEYIPQISDILMKYKIIRKPLCCVVRKGKSHYICDSKLKTYYSSVKKNSDPRDIRLLNVLQKLLETNDTQIDLDAYPLTRYIKDRICVTNKCGRHCNQYEYCRFISFSQKCLYDRFAFQIANHNYVFADLLCCKALLPDYKVIIFDEAHKLYDVSKQMYGCNISFTELSELEKCIEESGIDGLNKHCEELKWFWMKLLNRAASNQAEAAPYERREMKLDNFCLYYINSMIKLLDIIIVSLYDCDNVKLYVKKRSIRKMSEGLRDKFRFLLFPDELICWIEYDGNGYSFCAVPKELGKLVYKNIWSRDVLSVLTSGTLSVNGDFRLTEKKLGIDLVSADGISRTSKKSPFCYEENALIYIPEHLPFPNIHNHEYIQMLVAEIDSLLKAAYGHSLVLFTSYKLMELVFDSIRKNNYDYPLFIMARGRVDALKDFKFSGNGVLFASELAGEGVDIVGDTLSNLIIVKLPFAVPDPISEYEQSVMGGLRRYMNEINTPNMIIKLKQYAGRLIRSEKDTGVLAILDSRVNSSGKYRKTVLESLFNAPVTDSINDVEQFIIDKKNEKYFT